MEAKEFEVGEQVTTMVNNVKVHGVVASIQLQKNLVDVKIYEPGNTHHCLTVARPPEEVKLDEEKVASA